MLSKIFISALLVLQSGLVAADDTSGRKVLRGINARGLLVRQSTCPAGSFMCADGTGCCDTGTTCGFRASDNYPICKGGSCNGGPICLSGLCCDLGYVCNESTKLCAKSGVSNNPSSSIPIVTPSSTKASASPTKASSSPTKASTRTSSSATPTSSADDESDPSTATDDPSDVTSQTSSPTRRTTATTAFPTSILDFGSPASFTNSLPTFGGNGLPTSLPLGSGAEAHPANSVAKIIVGAVAGVLAFVL